MGGPVGTIVRIFPFSVHDGAGMMTASLDNTNPVHAQVWREELAETDYLGYRGFNEFVDKAVCQEPLFERYYP